MKTIPLKIIIILLFLQFKLNAQENQSKPSLHLILCGPELSLSPTNNDIYSVAQKDLWNMRITFFILAYQVGMQFDCVDFETRLNKENFSSFFDKLQILPDDIIVFYFSGQGFRTKETQNDFPMITRNIHSIDISKEAIELMEIKKIIDAKALNKNFVIADCCNSNYSATLVQEDQSAYRDTALINSLRREIYNSDTLNIIQKGMAEKFAIFSYEQSKKVEAANKTCEIEINISKSFHNNKRCLPNRRYLKALFQRSSIIVSSSAKDSDSFFSDNGSKFTELFCKGLIEFKDVNYNNYNWERFFDAINSKMLNQKCIFSVKPN